MSNSIKYYPHFDGLRAILFIFVFLYHISEKWVPNGILTIDCFFLLSGFVITKSFSRFSGGIGSISVAFYARRFKRIVPPLLIAITLASFLTVLFVPLNFDLTGFKILSLYSHLGLANFNLISSGINYFEPKAYFNPYLHLWSLGVEEQFYFVFPILFYFSAKYFKLNSARILFFAALTLASLLLHFGTTDILIKYYSPWTRFWPITLGVLIALTTQRAPYPKTLANVSLLFFMGHLFVEPNLYSSYIGMVAAALFFWAAKDDFGSLSVKLLSNAPTVFFGKMSYSLYLFHWVYISIAHWTFGLGSPGKIAIVFAITFLSSLLVHWFVEEPIKNKSAWPMKTQKGSLIAFGFIIAGFALVNYTIYSSRLQLSFSKANIWEITWLPLYSDSFAAHCAPKLDRFSFTHYKFTPQKGCGPETKKQKLFVIGDSHTMSYFGLIENMVKTTGIEAHMVFQLGGACGLLTGIDLSQRTNRCVQHISNSLNYIKSNAKPNDIVFLASFRLQDIILQYTGGDYVANDAEIVDLIERRWENLEKYDIEQIKELSDLGLKIIVDLPKPIYGSVFYRCRESYQEGNEACIRGTTMSRSWLLDLRKPVAKQLSVLQEQYKQLHVWDPFPSLCPESSDGLCSAVREDKYVFFDQHHLSAFGNEVLLQSFLKDAVLKLQTE